MVNPFCCRCFHFPSSVALKAGPWASLQMNSTALEKLFHCLKNLLCIITVMFGTLWWVFVSFFFNVTLCFTDEGRNAVDHAGGAHIVVDHIRSLCNKTDPASEKLLTVFCGMLMNYSNENGKQHQKLALCLPGEQPHQKRGKKKINVKL